jgi:hypothetical protein
MFSANGSQRLLLSPTRIYDPVTGRFLQNEPVLSRRTRTQYLFVANNPLAFVDPIGMGDVSVGWRYTAQGYDAAGNAVQYIGKTIRDVVTRVEEHLGTRQDALGWLRDEATRITKEEIRVDSSYTEGQRADALSKAEQDKLDDEGGNPGQKPGNKNRRRAMSLERMEKCKKEGITYKPGKKQNVNLDDFLMGEYLEAMLDIQGPPLPVTIPVYAPSRPKEPSTLEEWLKDALVGIGKFVFGPPKTEWEKIQDFNATYSGIMYGEQAPGVALDGTVAPNFGGSGVRVGTGRIGIGRPVVP